MEDKTIDLRNIKKRIKENLKAFFIVMPVVFILACLFFFTLPRYYTCEVKLAPESDLPQRGMASLASSLLGNDANFSTDAIQPALYPDLLISKDFIVGLFSVQVCPPNTGKSIDYYTYIRDFQEVSSISRLLRSFQENKPKWTFTPSEVKSFYLTKEQNEVAKFLQDNIKCVVDRKTSVITIKVTDQSGVVSAQVADTIRVKLQSFITNYRTNKARNDLKYYKDLVTKAKRDYDKARNLYASCSDSNFGAILTSVRVRQKDLENDMQMKYEAYTSYNTQLRMALAKIQERTPAFTILQGASVPEKPAGPKRVLAIALTMIAALLLQIIFIMRHDIKELFI